MSNNSKQCAYWSLVIHDGAACYNDFSQTLNEICLNDPNFEYSYIFHEPDDDCEKKHLHLVLYFKGKVKRFTTIQTLFSGAHIEQTNKQRYKRCIQYLIHKNNPEKKQYKPTEIFSNIETSLLAEILTTDGYDYELFVPDKILDYVKEIFKEKQDVSCNDFIIRFGLDAIRSYYFIIKDIIKEFKNDIVQLKLYLKRNDPIERAWVSYSKDLKRDWQLATYYNYINQDWDTFSREAYEQFLLDIEKGYIDISKF